MPNTCTYIFIYLKNKHFLNVQKATLNLVPLSQSKVATYKLLVTEYPEEWRFRWGHEQLRGELPIGKVWLNVDFYSLWYTFQIFLQIVLLLVWYWVKFLTYSFEVSPIGCAGALKAHSIITEWLPEHFTESAQHQEALRAAW